MQCEIRITGDGSATLFVPELNEHYHSIHGAVQESKHVFIDMGLKSIYGRYIRIFEFGFGTGLNALLTLLNGLGKVIVYHTMELFPLTWEEVEKLGYHKFLRLTEKQFKVFKQMHDVKWEEEIAVTSDFILKKIKASILEYPLHNSYDLIYFDAFAPGIQPELWDKAVFSKLYDLMIPNAILVTYCAKGEVRRILQHAGFIIERLSGPPGKREMLRAIRL